MLPHLQCVAWSASQRRLGLIPAVADASPHLLARHLQLLPALLPLLMALLMLLLPAAAAAVAGCYCQCMSCACIHGDGW